MEAMLHRRLNGNDERGLARGDVDRDACWPIVRVCRACRHGCSGARALLSAPLPAPPMLTWGLILAGALDDEEASSVGMWLSVPAASLGACASAGRRRKAAVYFNQPPQVLLLERAAGSARGAQTHRAPLDDWHHLQFLRGEWADSHGTPRLEIASGYLNLAGTCSAGGSGGERRLEAFVRSLSPWAGKVKVLEDWGTSMHRTAPSYALLPHEPRVFVAGDQ